MRVFYVDIEVNQVLDHAKSEPTGTGTEDDLHPGGKTKGLFFHDPEQTGNFHYFLGCRAKNCQVQDTQVGRGTIEECSQDGKWASHEDQQQRDLPA